MLKGYRGIVAALGLVALLAITVGAITWPIVPALQRYSYDRPDTEDYLPGGRKCDPSSIAAIPVGGKRLGQAEACEEKAQTYRHDRNDLVQQTRAADAAEAQAEISSQGLWTAWLQTLGGFLTLCAAVGAAIYARDAAVQGKRGAEAAETAVCEARRIGEAQVRCYLSISGAVLSFVKDEIFVACTVKNSGQSPANKVQWRVLLHVIYSTSNRASDLIKGSVIDGIEVIGAQSEHRFLEAPSDFGLIDDDLAVIRSGNEGVGVLGVFMVTGEDVFGNRLVGRHNFMAVLNDIPDGGVTMHPIGQRPDLTGYAW